MMLVSSRLGWLRLVLAALLCAAGIARPVAARCAETSAARGDVPVQLATTERRVEGVRIGARGDEITGDPDALLGHASVRPSAFASEAARRAPRLEVPRSVPRHLLRARGPPRT